MARALLRLAAALLAAALLALLPGGSANHAQPAGSATLSFDHKTGNEWWVEVVLGGSAAASVTGVQAMDTNGPWTALAKSQWGAWAGSFRIEPGHLVKFRATTSAGVVESCWFTHPAGAEQCGGTTSTSSSGTSTSGGFDAGFTGFRGNEWWVQANVATNGPSIAKVDVRIAPDGPWMPLSKQSWGPTAWAASHHFPQGSILQMRATASDGRTDLSSCRQWIPPSGQDAALVACPSRSSTTTTSSGPQPFDATWSNVRGNEYWVEAVVRANAPIQSVLLTVDCNPLQDPHDMVYRADWGKWVLGGIAIPSGSTVLMTAVGPDGAMDSSANYRWPQATVTADCPEAWPQDGSFAQVRFKDELREFDGEGGERSLLADGLLDLVFTEGVGWRGTCEQRITEMGWDGAWSNRTESVAWTSGFGPPTASVPSPIGSTASIETLDGCSKTWLESTVLARETRTFSIRDSSGDPRAIDAYKAGDSSSGHFANYWYDARLGLVLDWHEHSSSQHHVATDRGWLLNTDYTFPTPP